MLLTLEVFEHIKGHLDEEAIHLIASDLGIPAAEVRQYFTALDEKKSGVHIRKGNYGSYVLLDNSAIFEAAFDYLQIEQLEASEALATS